MLAFLIYDLLTMGLIIGIAISILVFRMAYSYPMAAAAASCSLRNYNLAYSS